MAIAALAGEWLGHTIAYYRSAGIPGLRAGLAGGVHGYMLPLALALLIVAGAGAAGFTRAWLGLGRRLDRAAATVRRLSAGGRGPSAPPEVTATPQTPLSSTWSRLVALALPLGLAQCALYVVQENLERIVHGFAGRGTAPLTDSFGAAAWIQLATAALLAVLLFAAAALLHSRHRAVAEIERRARALWLRVWRRPAVGPSRSAAHVVPCRLLFGCALWQRPPPPHSAV